MKIYILVNKDNKKNIKKIIKYYGYNVDTRVKEFIDKVLINISNEKYNDLKLLIETHIGCIDVDIHRIDRDTLNKTIIEYILKNSKKNIINNKFIITFDSLKTTIMKIKDLLIIYNLLKLEDPFERTTNKDVEMFNGFSITKDAKKYIDDIINTLDIDIINENIRKYDLSLNYETNIDTFKTNLINEILELSKYHVVDYFYKFKKSYTIEIENIYNVIISDIDYLTMFNHIDDYKNIISLKEGDYPTYIDGYYHNLKLIPFPKFIKYINSL